MDVELKLHTLAGKKRVAHNAKLAEVGYIYICQMHFNIQYMFTLAHIQ